MTIELDGATPAPSIRHRVARVPAGVVCGIIAGVLVANAMQVGVIFIFPGEDSSGWHVLWGEHWAIRFACSIVASFAAGAISGAIARRAPLWTGIATSVPSLVLWGWIAYALWYPPAPDAVISIGNKVCAVLIFATTIPATLYGAASGTEWIRAFAIHFDTRRHTLLGVPWYHFLWIPFVLHFAIAQTTWSAFFAVPWIAMTFRSYDSNGISILPFLFLMALWYSATIPWVGAWKAYAALAQLDGTLDREPRAIFKYAVMFPLGAACVQVALFEAQVMLVRWLSR